MVEGNSGEVRERNSFCYTWKWSFDKLSRSNNVTSTYFNALKCNLSKLLTVTLQCTYELTFSNLKIIKDTDMDHHQMNQRTSLEALELWHYRWRQCQKKALKMANNGIRNIFEKANFKFRQNLTEWDGGKKKLKIKMTWHAKNRIHEIIERDIDKESCRFWKESHRDTNVLDK